jgi:hypothetical protein
MGLLVEPPALQQCVDPIASGENPSAALQQPAIQVVSQAKINEIPQDK